MTTGAMLLAAGGSSRLGFPKQLVELDGKTLVRRAAEALLAAGCAPVVTVVGAQAERVIAALTGLPVNLIKNDRWADGMASSIRSGLAGLTDCDAALIALCDQPRIAADDYRALLDAFAREAKPAIAALYHGKPGVPAIFARRLFSRLEALSGDTGARGLLLDLGDDVGLFPLPTAELDLDSPADLDALNLPSGASPS